MSAISPLACENLSAVYNSRVIFHSLTLALKPGVFALRGPNGIGKSTALRLLAGAQRPATGQIRIDGIDLLASPETAKRQLSYVPDICPVYPFMTGEEFLRFVAAAKQTTLDDTVRTLIDTFGLTDILRTRFDAMSFGTQKKIMLCAAWIGAPRVILLDEPGNGLDGPARDYLARLFRQPDQERVILFSTHDDALASASDAVTIEMQSLFRHSEPATT
ncbi:ABC transporter ATP-binding protein [Acetobacter fallax]|uniref:ATP-binding cassette domain-containing protein n=1 Tax=Acetobacter fallax TaxID=1737473 RepID=A0ABX0KC43_9PROT|nr:ABC transporter ATP-binding protein [Acetobacter fallax]NHO32621.1 ATP-binding cassette domain-containing protein [Acetobacter fallax]NHO36181.1 ATP-binding cassette domain-containing protein [Acetobacter fallax]